MRDILLGCALSLAALTAASVAAPDSPAAPMAQLTPATRPTSAAGRSKPAAKPAATARQLEITVLDAAAGRPVAGALVVAVTSVGAYTGAGQIDPERRRSLLTSSEGTAQFGPMPAPPWDVIVRARGFAPEFRTRVGAGPLTLRLQRGASLAGVVRDGTTKLPVAGAQVAVEGGLPMPSDWEERAVENRATTDKRGRFRLDGLGRGSATLVARAAGYGAGRREAARPGSPVEIFLFPGATLTGTVRDERARPVRGASVRLQGDGWVSPGSVETTDENGGFLLAGLDAGEYLVVAREGARAPAIESAVVPSRGEVAVDLRLGSGGFLSGRVVDGAAKPLPGARVRVVSFEDRGLPPFLADALAGESSAAGTFALGPVPEGRLAVSVSLQRHVPRRVAVDVGAGQTVDLGEVVLEPGLVIRGRVRDAAGDVVAGAVVSATREGGPGEDAGGDAASAQVETEADGTFALAGLTAGRYSVTAALAGFARASKRGEAGGEPMELVLLPGGSISGRVVDSSGTAVDGASIYAETATPAHSGGRFMYASSGAAEGEGRFVLRDVAEDSYGLRIRATGYGEGAVANVKVVAGRDTDVGIVTLGTGGSVSGTVVDAEGQGIPGAAIRVERGSNLSTGDLNAQTGSDGTFEVRGVPPGRVEVTATHPAYVGSRVRGVEVDPAKEPTPVRIVLTRGGRIEGRARHRDGSPFVGGRIQVWPQRGGAAVAGLDLVPTAEDGSFVLEHVPAGSVRVNLLMFVPAHPYGGGGAGVSVLGGVAVREAEVREGETTAVDVLTREVVVAGRVTRASRGVASVRVTVMTQDSAAMISYVGPNAPRATGPQQGPPPLSAVTREDGSYELLVFGPGRGQVSLVSESSRQRHPGREVEIPDAERFELDLELGETTVSGIVLDRETGAPIAEAGVSLRAADGEGAWKGGATATQDGRFSLSADAGEYVIEVRAEGRKSARVPISVGASGLSDVRIELEPGLEIVGRLVDSSGRPQLGAIVYASDPEQARPGPAIYGNTQPDGAFRLSGLEAKPYLLTSGSDLNGFAIRPGVSPGGEPVTLRLKPGGRILVTVVGPDGVPAKDVYPQLSTWDGLRLYGVHVQARPTETPGEYELSAPEGTIGVQVGWDKPYGSATATVRAGETVSVAIRLRELPPK